MMKVTALLSSKPVNKYFQVRLLSQLAANYSENAEDKAQAWQVHAYGGIEELKLNHAKIPPLLNPSDILVKVDASSVNPIDIAMMGGYGSTALDLVRKAKSTIGIPYSDIVFPLTLGRDFSGTVISKGHGVDKFSVGDQVWGVIPIEEQGCHANCVVARSCMVRPHPKNLSHIEAASILYAGLTAWSALWYTGGLCLKTVFPSQAAKRTLVLGGSGGVGTLAIQLLKAWNMQVVTTCNTDAVEMLQGLGADVAVDYNEPDSDNLIISEGPYDIILDCCNQGSETVKAKGYPHCTYITLNSPLLKNFDEHGVLMGAVKNVGDLVLQNIPTSPDKLSFVKWGFILPAPNGFDTIQELVETDKIKPVVQEVFPFENLPKAYERVCEGHMRGKVVVDMR